MSTIAAVSTPHGRGGVALIRISGENAFDVAERVFTPFGKSAPRKNIRRQIYGSFSCDGTEFDDGLCCFFASPNSFTGEDTAELCCHGGVLCAQKLLAACIAAGASYAAAGEFTKRAFINGALSLTRAEAIGGLIDARTDEHLRVSLLQSRGGLSNRINALYGELAHLAASAYAFIDYPTEDLTDVTPDEALAKLKEIHSSLSRLCDSHAYGRAISDGIPTVIAGKPNVGKSSLLNLLAGSDRAIVTNTAGTTRDVITERVKLGGLLLDLSDTAGIRESIDEIEQIGVGKSLEAIDKAALVIAVFDASRPLDSEDGELISRLKDKTVIALKNKRDAGDAGITLPFKTVIDFSVKDEKGLDSLTKAVADCVGDTDFKPEEIILGARQYAAVLRARDEVAEAIAALEGGFTLDIALTNAESAMEALSELDGRSVSQSIVDEIFSHFCVGK